MDKNMINIDDLVRQRLSGGEERERVGAWTNMQALLDKEMPTDPVVTGFNWRRITGYLTGLLLLAALSVGGYKGYQHIEKNSQQGLAENSLDKHGANGSGANETGNIHSDHITTAGEVAQQINGQDANNIRPSGEDGDFHATNTAVAKNNSRASVAAYNNDGRNLSATNKYNVATGNDNPSSESNAATNNADHNNTAAGAGPNNAGVNTADNKNTGNTQSAIVQASKRNAIAIAEENTAATNKGTLTTNNPEARNTISKSNIPAANTPSNNAITATNNNSANSTTNNKGTQNNNNNTPATAMMNPASGMDNSTNNNPALNFIKDTIQKIRLLQRYVRDNTTHIMTMKVDTLAIEHEIVYTPVITPLVAEKKEMPLGISEPNPAQNTTANKKNSTSKTSGMLAKTKAASAPVTTNPAAMSPSPVISEKAAEADASSVLVPLANYKVSSHKSYAWDPERFKDMVRNAKFNMAQVKFYPGIVAGVNASFGSNSMAGIQLGLSGLFALNDHWSILSEIKYINHFNSGMSISDNYTNTIALDSAGRYHNNQFYKIYTRTDDSADHYFNYTTVHSLELPLAVRYAFGRLYVMGGINLSYSFRVSTEEIDQHTQVVRTLDSTIYSNIIPQTTLTGAPKITTKDFDSRFGLGYLVGLGYQITPAVQLDVRMTRTFWDNAQSEGAKRVSDELFKMPNVQISVGYRFSQNKKR